MKNKSDIVASDVQNVSVVHSHCPECKRGMHFKYSMYVKYNDIAASGVQNVSVVRSHYPKCEHDMGLKHPMYAKYNDIMASDVQNVVMYIAIVQNAGVACISSIPCI